MNRDPTPSVHRGVLAWAVPPVQHAAEGRACPCAAWAAEMRKASNRTHVARKYLFASIFNSSLSLVPLVPYDVREGTIRTLHPAAHAIRARPSMFPSDKSQLHACIGHIASLHLHHRATFLTHTPTVRSSHRGQSPRPPIMPARTSLGHRGCAPPPSSLSHISLPSLSHPPYYNLSLLLGATLSPRRRSQDAAVHTISNDQPAAVHLAGAVPPHLYHGPAGSAAS